MKELIKGLYFGEILPLWEVDTRTTEYISKTRELQRIWEEIITKHPDTEPLLEEYRGVHYESANLMSYQQFLLGIRTGAQLMLELLEPINEHNK